ncbi:MAG: hypothetical protein ACKVZ0_09645 [Gemmatimonadales bacterium]
MTDRARLVPTIAAGLVVVSGLFGAADPIHGQVVDSTTLRPTDVTVIITNDTHYDGTYRAHGISRVCGKLDLMMPHRANSFVVEFPDDEPNLEVRSLSFNADTLAAGSTITSFYLTVGIRLPNGGTPPHFVVRASQPQYNEPGTAQRTKTASRDSLDVAGKATKGTKVDVKATVVCHPKP